MFRSFLAPAPRRLPPPGAGRPRGADEKRSSGVLHRWSRIRRPISSEQAFYQGAIPGLLRTLDPHSVFFDPGQFEQLKKMETSTQKGFGSVVSLLPGPRHHSPDLAGHPIREIRDYARRRDPRRQRLHHRPTRYRADYPFLSQSRQRQARLDVAPRRFAELLQFTLAPEDMQSPSVDRAFFLGAGIGYVRVSSFDEKTGAELKEASRSSEATGSRVWSSISATIPAGWSPPRSRPPPCFCLPA